MNTARFGIIFSESLQYSTQNLSPSTKKMKLENGWLKENFENVIKLMNLYSVYVFQREFSCLLNTLFINYLNKIKPVWFDKP